MRRFTFHSHESSTHYNKSRYIEWATREKYYDANKYDRTKARSRNDLPIGTGAMAEVGSQLVHVGVNQPGPRWDVHKECHFNLFRIETRRKLVENY